MQASSAFEDDDLEIPGSGSMTRNGTTMNEQGKRSISYQLGRDPAKRNTAHAVNSIEARDTYCRECRIEFSRPYVLQRHLNTVHMHIKNFVCEYSNCNLSFTRRDTLHRHKETQHGLGKIQCPSCGCAVRKDGLAGDPSSLRAQELHDRTDILDIGQSPLHSHTLVKSHRIIRLLRIEESCNSRSR